MLFIAHVRTRQGEWEHDQHTLVEADSESAAEQLVFDLLADDADEEDVDEGEFTVEFDYGCVSKQLLSVTPVTSLDDIRQILPFIQEAK